jgi:transcriptional regulator with XRE-family HTH domain
LRNKLLIIVSMTDDAPPRIKRLRLALGWPQSRLAEWLGLTQAAVSLMEKGQPESGPVSKLLDMLSAQMEAGDLRDTSTISTSPFPKEAAE